MRVAMLSVDDPVDQRLYARALRQVGAEVVGVGRTPSDALADDVLGAIDRYVHVDRLPDDDAGVDDLAARIGPVDRVEGLPYGTVRLAAALRERLDVAGPPRAAIERAQDPQTVLDVLVEAGVPVLPAVWGSSPSELAPAFEGHSSDVILGPPWARDRGGLVRVTDVRELERVWRRLPSTGRAWARPLLAGEEYALDALCLRGKPAWRGIARFLPRVDLAWLQEWVSPEVIAIRHMDDPVHAPLLALLDAVVDALPVGTGFVTVRALRRPDGQVLVVDATLRPGPWRAMDLHNYAADVDGFVEWARAVVKGKVSPQRDRSYNVAIVSKRAQGPGRVRHIDGLDGFAARHGARICAIDLPPVGAYRRDFDKHWLGDGFVIVRHAEWDEVVRVADAAATEIRIVAGG